MKIKEITDSFLPYKVVLFHTTDGGEFCIPIYRIIDISNDNEESITIVTIDGPEGVYKMYISETPKEAKDLINLELTCVG